MKIRQVVIGLSGLIALGIAFGVGRYFRPIPRLNYDFNIYVRSGPTPGKCIVRPPIQLMSYNNDRVQWVSEDKQYWVDFTHITPPPGYPPIPPNPPYTPESPLAHDQDHVPFSPGHPTGLSKVHQKEKYYYFAIFDQPDPNQPPCKVSTDDNDTGLNVKP